MPPKHGSWPEGRVDDLGRAPASTGPHVTSDRLRIGTWNIASNKNHDAIVSRIAQLDVDICAVQEVLLDCAVDD